MALPRWRDAAFVMGVDRVRGYCKRHRSINRLSWLTEARTMFLMVLSLAEKDLSTTVSWSVSENGWNKSIIPQWKRILSSCQHIYIHAYLYPADSGEGLTGILSHALACHVPRIYPRPCYPPTPKAAGTQTLQRREEDKEESSHDFVGTSKR